MNLTNTIKTKLLLTTMAITFSLSCSAGGSLYLLGDDKIFVFTAGGATKLNVDSSLSPGTTLSQGALDDSGKVLELGVGYHYSRDYFITLTAQKSTLNIADINDIYGSINYKFSLKNIQPYIGALAGYSQLDWSKRPHAMLINENLTSNSPLYGIQAGMDKRIRKNTSIFLKYQYIKYDHKIEILNNTSNIEHTSGENILAGIRYLF